MPQMKPMNWIILFLIFTLIMLMNIIMNFYNLFNKTKYKHINKNNSYFMHWKW